VSFPKRGQIFQDRIDRIKSTVARPSLDTFYEVNFSFGKYQTWLGDASRQKKNTRDRLHAKNEVDVYTS